MSQAQQQTFTESYQREGQVETEMRRGRDIDRIKEGEQERNKEGGQERF